MVSSVSAAGGVGVAVLVGVTVDVSVGVNCMGVGVTVGVDRLTNDGKAVGEVVRGLAVAAAYGGGTSRRVGIKAPDEPNT